MWWPSILKPSSPSANGEGTLTVVHEDSPDKYSVVANVPTQRGARTIAFGLEDSQGVPGDGSVRSSAPNNARAPEPAWADVAQQVCDIGLRE